MIVSKNKEFFQKFNESFANGDKAFIIENFTENVQWTQIGRSPIQGKSKFAEVIGGMEHERIIEYVTTNMITHGNTAAIEGTMKLKHKSGEIKSYAFCHICRLDKFIDGKIQEMTSYVIEMDQ